MRKLEGTNYCVKQKISRCSLQLLPYKSTNEITNPFSVLTAKEPYMMTSLYTKARIQVILTSVVKVKYNWVKVETAETITDLTRVSVQV